MKRILLLLSVLILSCVSLSAYPALKKIMAWADEETYQKILDGETVKENTSGGDLRRIAPESELVSARIDSILSMEKGFAVALAALVPYPEGWDGMTRDEQKRALYNTLLKVSTMSGITYISHRAGDKEVTLFDECSMLSSDNRKDRISDPVVQDVPLYAEYYSYQDDTSFGGNVYSMAYTAVNDEIFMDIRNNEDLKFMGISLVKKGKVNMCLDFTRTEEGIYVYALASVRDKKPKVTVLFYTVDLELSFYNRIVALSKWFTAALHS